MKIKAETRIKRLLRSMHKAIMQWYAEHPEGAIDSEGSGNYYGSAYFVVTDEGEVRARMTLQAGDGHFTDIVASNHGKKVSV